jgi:hypothetical protein
MDELKQYFADEYLLYTRSTSYDPIELLFLFYHDLIYPMLTRQYPSFEEFPNNSGILKFCTLR